MTAFVDTAKYFAVAAHAAVNQKRRYTGEDYYWHCAKVAALVCEYGGTERMIAAAWLHDVVEDTGVTVDLVKECFGDIVGSYVEALTDVETGNRAERKAKAVIRLGNACAEAQTIKLADLIDNTSTIVKYDKSFAKVYMAEKRELLKVLTKGNKLLWNRANKIVENYFKGEA